MKGKKATKVVRQVHIKTLQESIALLDKRDRRFYREFKGEARKKKKPVRGRWTKKKGRLKTKG